MKLSRASFKSNFILCCIGLLAFSSCYQGWKRPDTGEGTGGSGSGGGLSKSEKPVGFALVDVFRPSLEALAAPQCGGAPGSLIELRAQEIAARERSIIDQVIATADETRVETTVVEASDCVRFQAIEARARTRLQSLSPSITTKAKRTLHLRVYLWVGGAGHTDPSPDVGREWADMRALSVAGFSRRLSILHFAVTGPSTGYLDELARRSALENRFIAETVDRPQPSAEGQQAVASAIANSAAQFAQWLSQRLSRL